MPKKVPESLLDVVRKPILRTWDNIAADGYELCEGDNECAIELCIDANRLTSFAHGKELEEAKAADKVLDDVMKDCDYKKVLKFLSKRIQLL